MTRDKPFTNTSSSKSTASSGTVARTAMLLRVLAEAEGDCNLSAIAEQMNLPLSTTHRLLGLLQQEGFVDRGDDLRTYRVGLGFLRLCGLVAARAQIPEIAQHFMQKVVDACGETCVLSLYMPREQKAMIAKTIHGAHPLRYETQMYRMSSLAWGATGRGILAFLPDDVIDQVLAQNEASPNDGKKLPKAAQVKRELAQIRAAGYAISYGQKIPDAVGLSAPVFNHRGAIAALCITMPEARFDARSEADIADVLKEQAAHFSRTLGWSEA